MLDWITAHSSIINTALNGLMTLVWVIYLHLLVTGTQRQRRTNIFINRSADRGDKAECVVTNLGAETVYLIDVIADLSIDGEVRSTIVTDREELGDDDISNMLERSNQVPLGPGESRDIGNFRNLVWRAMNRLDVTDCEDRVTGLKLTVVVAGHENRIAAAEKEYYVLSNGERQHEYVPKGLMPKQLRSKRTRRRIQKRMEESLRLETEEAQERFDRNKAA